MGAAAHYLICTTPRTGSSFLCELLGSSGIAGMQRASHVVGAEYLLELVGRPEQRIETGPLDRARLRRFLHDALERSSTSNGVAGFKVMWAQIPQLAARLEPASAVPRFGADDFAALLPPGTRFVRLIRRDRVRQAVSLAKAIQTQCWNSGEQEQYAGRCRFDYIGVLRISKRIERHEAKWGEFFDRNDITPLEVAYEDLIADRDGQARRILEFIGVAGDGDGANGEVHYRRQSDAVNEAWLRRFEKIRSCSPVRRAAYAVLFTPRWLVLRATQGRRVRRRVRRLPSGELLSERRDRR